MYDAYSRMELLLGPSGVDRLGRAQIAVFGLGEQVLMQWRLLPAAE